MSWKIVSHNSQNIKKNEGCATAERYVSKVLRYMEVPGENQRPITSHWPTLSHNFVLSIPSRALKEPQGHKNNSSTKVQFLWGILFQNFHIERSLSFHFLWGKMLKYNYELVNCSWPFAAEINIINTENCHIWIYKYVLCILKKLNK